MDVTDKSTIDKVISIVNNIVYKGNNETTQELDSKLKDKLKESFVDFFGERHKDKINHRIDEMNIQRCYHVFGTRNSISSFLEDEKTKIFNENRENPINDPYVLSYYTKTPIEEILNEASNNSFCHSQLLNTCDFLGLKMEDLKTHDGQIAFQSLAKQAHKSYVDTPYSGDPERNSQMNFLNEYVDSYRDYLKSEYEKLGNSIDESFNNPYAITRFDPIYNQLMSGMPIGRKVLYAEKLFTNSGSEAFNIRENIYLGLNPDSESIIHEAFHGVVYKEDLKMSSGFHQEDGQRYFNEVITEYYSQMIHDKFLAKNGTDLTENNQRVLSTYEAYLFKYMKPFMQSFGPEFKETLMRDDPVSAMKQIIGDREFDEIAECCDTIYTFGHCANSNELLSIIGELDSVTTSAITKKPSLERVANVISTKAESAANSIRKQEYSHLQKLAKGLYTLSNYMNQYTQGKVADRLDRNASSGSSNEMNDQMQDEMEDDNEMVMEMKF